MGPLAERPYWPSGVKLDSKITFAPNGEADAHTVIWVLQWDDVSAFSAADYYAHDLYLDKVGGTFLEVATLEINSTLPLVQRYRTADNATHLRLGWATYRPHQIQANTRYTVTLSSAVTASSVDDGAEDVETYGLRLPSTCVSGCLWLPLSWCSIAPGGATLRLFNNSHPAGIHPLGVPLGGCNTLLLLPFVAR